MFFKVGDCSRNSESAFIQFYIEFLFIQNHMKKKKNSKFSHRSDLLSTELILYIKAPNSSSKIESKQMIGIKLALESFKCPYSFLYFNVLTYLFQKIVLLVCFALSVYVCAFAYYVETVSFYYRLLFLSQFTMFTFYILILQWKCWKFYIIFIQLHIYRFSFGIRIWLDFYLIGFCSKVLLFVFFSIILSKHFTSIVKSYCFSMCVSVFLVQFVCLFNSFSLLFILKG